MTGSISTSEKPQTNSYQISAKKIKTWVLNQWGFEHATVCFYRTGLFVLVCKQRRVKRVLSLSLSLSLFPGISLPLNFGHVCKNSSPMSPDYFIILNIITFNLLSTGDFMCLNDKVT